MKIWDDRNACRHLSGNVKTSVFYVLLVTGWKKKKAFGTKKVLCYRPCLEMSYEMGIIAESFVVIEVLQYIACPKLFDIHDVFGFLCLLSISICVFKQGGRGTSLYTQIL